MASLSLPLCVNLCWDEGAGEGEWFGFIILSQCIGIGHHGQFFQTKLFMTAWHLRNMCYDSYCLVCKETLFLNKLLVIPQAQVSTQLSFPEIKYILLNISRLYRAVSLPPPREVSVCVCQSEGEGCSFLRVVSMSIMSFQARGQWHTVCPSHPVLSLFI